MPIDKLAARTTTIDKIFFCTMGRLPSSYSIKTHGYCNFENQNFLWLVQIFYTIDIGKKEFPYERQVANVDLPLSKDLCMGCLPLCNLLKLKFDRSFFSIRSVRLDKSNRSHCED